MVKDDPVEFTGRVLELLDNPELRLSKSREAKKHARSWSIEELTKKLINIYKSTTAAYTEEYGDHVTPIWELIRIKSRWIKNNMVIRKAYRKK